MNGSQLYEQKYATGRVKTGKFRPRRSLSAEETVSVYMHTYGGPNTTRLVASLFGLAIIDLYNYCLIL